ncbi:MAG: amidohydrolase [Acidobacteria bacterium]|nr:MAG: amidohydrolase [Acidobacteriota bacterium]
MNDRPSRSVTSNLSRRDFLGTAAMVMASALPAPQAEAQPILDLHQHTKYNGRPDQQLLAHQAYHHITRTVLLPGEGWMLSIVGDNETCAALVKQYPERFLLFACSDVAESRTPYVLRGDIRRGALGIGELKFRVAVDSPEMHRVYKLAEELVVPVLLHFEHQTYNTGFERFESILKAYPKVNFIGHAQTWWGNISADLDPRVLYPKGPVKRGGLTDRLLADYPNIYGDLSADSGLNALTRDAEFARDFVRRHTRKLIWGSDCDCHDGMGAETQDGYCIATRSLAMLRQLVPDDAAFRQIVYENGAALLGLKRVS